MSNQLSQLISLLNGGSVYIRTHNFPDPDAIASAYGLQYLLNKHNITSTICFSGKIDRYNTKKMLDQLHIDYVAFEEITDIGEQDHIIYIDAQHANANVQKEDHILANLYCIDHHPIYTYTDYRFSDIRPDYGSCATIIGEYFLENNIAFTTEIATALIYGLKIDTANLSRGVGKADLDTFYQLYAQCNQDLLQSIEHNTMMVTDLTAYSNAIQTLDMWGDFCFADCGSNCQEALIATICDFLVSLAVIELAIVYSVREEGIKISVRSIGGHYNAGEICNYALTGLGNGGGHARMAGGFIPLNTAPYSPEDRELQKKLLIQKLKERFKKAITE